MKQKSFFLCLVLILLVSSSIAQQRVIAKFVVTDATINNGDITESYVNSGGYLVLYTNSNENEIYMGNVMSKVNSQSYGRIYGIERRKSNDIAESDILFYRWSYKNNYDNKSGTATVKIVSIRKPQGITFTCTIVPENLDVIVYKGFVEGTVDLSSFLR